VRLLGFVADEDLPALMSLAEAFAYPSVYEGFGLPPLEAMACGTPTVVSDASCLPEVVGEAALVVPVGQTAALTEALVALVAGGELRHRLAAAGPARAARFTWEACAASAEAAYGRVLGGG
jgi:glycosyltransferase involved in cell wall biosynthesis